jgi:curved DNA-binding protein CbpA
MASTVRSRPNHYETLGLTPTAGDDEILRAFGKQMSMFRARPMAAAAQIGVAYETLRNPIKRRAYDASLGLGPQAEARHSPAAATAPVPEGRLASFIAEALREPVNEAPRDRSSGAGVERNERHRTEAEAMPSAEAEVDLFRTFDRDQGPAIVADQHRVAWRGPALAAGALVLAAAAVGVVAGWQGKADEPQQAERSVSVALPPAKPLPDVAAAPPAPALARSVVETTPERPRPVAVPEARVERTPSPPQLAASEERQPEATQSEGNRSGEGATSAESPPVAPAAANLPLPTAVMARTIERIGYACGQIASSTPVEGEAPGVYKVTCTSGDSYQAGPVKGRYHFRRWGKH